LSGRIKPKYTWLDRTALADNSPLWEPGIKVGTTNRHIIGTCNSISTAKSKVTHTHTHKHLSVCQCQYTDPNPAEVKMEGRGGEGGSVIGFFFLVKRYS
jgi:hypothetical protein